MHTRTSFDSRTRQGFTLIEVLTVLALIGILTMIAAPRVSGMIGANRLERALDGLAADLTLTRIRAIRESRTAVLRIDASSRYVLYIDSGTGQAADTIKRVNVPSSYPGVTLTPGTISFDSRGIMGDGATITATQDGRTRTLSVTGIGRIYRAY